eukprot:6180706-Pleurochrysis_carterae.AAC.4
MATAAWRSADVRAARAATSTSAVARALTTHPVEVSGVPAAAATLGPAAASPAAAASSAAAAAAASASATTA